jgi:hypothetical protein
MEAGRESEEGMDEFRKMRRYWEMKTPILPIDLDQIDDTKELAQLADTFAALAEYAEERRAWECTEVKRATYSEHFDPFYEKLSECVRWPQPNRYEGQAEL